MGEESVLPLGGAPPFLNKSKRFPGCAGEGIPTVCGLDNVENSPSLIDLLRTQLTNKRDP